MAFSLTRRRLAAAFTAGLAAVAAFSIASPAEGQKGSCAPLDVAFVVDNTGSMGGAIDNVKKGLGNIVSEAKSVSGGNVRYAVVTFPEDNVVVNQPFTADETAAKNAINNITLGGGGNIPESSDEAMNTVVNGLRASDRPAGLQTGDFQPPYRSGAQKIAILITDALPGGFDDNYTTADKDHVRTIANQAKAKGIRVTAVYVGGKPVPDPEIKGIMQNGWAKRTGGQYRTTTSDGTGASAAIRASIASCGGAAKKRMRLRGRPHVIRAGTTNCVTFTTTRKGKAVKGAKVTFAGRSKRTSSKGRTKFCVRFTKTGCRGAKATKSGYRTARTRVCVAAAPRFTG